MLRPPQLSLVISMLLLAACRPLNLPPTATLTPTPFVQCTPPPCQAGETYACPSGDCPGGCGTICVTITPGPGSVTPETPLPMCTPPACWSDEVYFCSGNCPNGCGTTCATRTPDPAGGPTPTFPPPGSVCALPQLSPGLTPGAPALSRCVSAETARVGETVSLFAQTSGIAAPIFSVQGRDAGDGFGYLNFQAAAENRVRALSASSEVIRVASVQASGTQLFVTLEALAPGAIVLDLYAGPVNGPFIAGEPVTLTVTSQ